jgi:anti-sigma regulatory factor (Ser/Thr protein kinase)
LITHWGVGLSPNMEKAPEPDGSQLGGYGLPFVRRVFDEVGFESRESGSTIRLRKCLIRVGDTVEELRRSSA